jgi:hypothetical protein
MHRRIVEMKLLAGADSAQWDGFYATTAGATVIFRPKYNGANIGPIALPQNTRLDVAVNGITASTGTVYVYRLEP